MKANLDPDKNTWHPSPLLGQIVLVTTLNADGVSNIAPKSWISMMVFEPPILALGCNVRHWTGRNILERKEFVINVPGAELAEVVWRSVSVDEAAMSANDSYAYLQQFVYLEGRTFGVVECSHKLVKV